MEQEGSAVCQQIPLIYVEELKTDLPVILEPDKPGGSFPARNREELYRKAHGALVCRLFWIYPERNPKWSGEESFTRQRCDSRILHGDPRDQLLYFPRNTGQLCVRLVYQCV